MFRQVWIQLKSPHIPVGSCAMIGDTVSNTSTPATLPPLLPFLTSLLFRRRASQPFHGSYRGGNISIPGSITTFCVTCQNAKYFSPDQVLMNPCGSKNVALSQKGGISSPKRGSGAWWRSWRWGIWRRNYWRCVALRPMSMSANDGATLSWRVVASRTTGKISPTGSGH